MSALKKAKGFKKSRPGLYLSIGTSLFGAVGVVKQMQLARREDDRLQLLDAIVSGAAILTSVAILVREVRRLDIDDVLADD
ncbi:hypothetical protein ACLIYM_04815 [Streptomyces fenghuangensis]|uniref:Uncharacterized protein n=1 Tax=Streptomyces chitinivorans TaxID=1257027 RepID=A0ABW7HVR0_9ACTN|nr:MULTISPECIES: hypothetical protein [Streptomyces]MBN3933042.1 hypothetical protein [Streptomyces verrucosisporus]MCG3042573.1 hypothetical protein [Streptomyces sp. ICN903]MDH2409537.1 hypothetical protein [Streptomyces chitinivorans]